MRRKEFNVDEQGELEQFLQESSFGYLGTIGQDGWPHITPLNYVYTQGAIYFHGSLAGEKMRSIAADSRVSFAVAKEYAILPSHWTGPKLACPATAFFKSVFITGRALPVTELGDKASALTAFMEKLQPEGGYEQINPADPDYAKQLKATSVVKIEIESITGKFKFGQNWPEEKTEAIIGQLQARGLPDDEETAQLMKRYCPHHPSGE